MIEEYRTIKEHTKYEVSNLGNVSNKTNRGNISICCLGKRVTAYGFQWRYAKEGETQ